VIVHELDPIMADVERRGSRFEPQRPERDIAMVAKTFEQDVAEALEFVDGHRVPEFSEAIVAYDGFGHRVSSHREFERSRGGVTALRRVRA
jgi:hypothetical protein